MASDDIKFPQPETTDAGQLWIYTTLSRIEQSQQDLRRELLGNGQPGRIQTLEDSIKGNAQELEGLKKKFWTAAGAFVIILPALKAAIQKLTGINLH